MADRKLHTSTSARPHWEDVLDLDVHAPPFHRNPPAWSQRLPICVLAGIATVIASYMALFQWA